MVRSMNSITGIVMGELWEFFDIDRNLKTWNLIQTRYCNYRTDRVFKTMRKTDHGNDFKGRIVINYLNSKTPPAL